MSFIVNDHQQAKRLRGFDDFCSRHFVPVEIKQPVFFSRERTTQRRWVFYFFGCRLVDIRKRPMTATTTKKCFTLGLC
jgi:hypothetical protein